MKRIISIFLSVPLLAFFVMIISTYNTNAKSINCEALKTEINPKIVDYGVDINDERWRCLNPNERHECLELPHDFIDSLSTTELLKWALGYPLLGEGIIFDNSSDRISFFSRVNYVFEALFAREDILDTMVDEYIIFLSANNLEENVSSTDKYADFLAQNLFFVSYFELNHSRLSSTQIDKLSNNYIVNDPTTMLDFDSTRSYTPGFTSSNQLATFNGAYYYAGIYGKYNVSSPCFMFSYGDFSDPEKTTYIHSMEIQCPDLHKISDPTLKFNCHSYAWIQNDLNNNYWYNNVMDFANSSAFTYIGENCAVATGDRLIIRDYYGDIKHSVVIQSVNNTPGSSNTISKCGYAGIYTGSLDNILYYYNGYEYKVYRLN